MTATTKPRYYTPTHTEHVTVSLSDFTLEEIREYLTHKGESEPSGGGMGEDGPLTISEDDVNRIATLSLCGQKEAARDWLIELVERRIGRSLRGPK